MASQSVKAHQLRPATAHAGPDRRHGASTDAGDQPATSTTQPHQQRLLAYSISAPMSAAFADRSQPAPPAARQSRATSARVAAWLTDGPPMPRSASAGSGSAAAAAAGVGGPYFRSGRGSPNLNAAAAALAERHAAAEVLAASRPACRCGAGGCYQGSQSGSAGGGGSSGMGGVRAVKDIEGLAEELRAMRAALAESENQNRLLRTERQRLEAELGRCRTNLVKAEELMGEREKTLSPNTGLSRMYRNSETTALVGKLREQLTAQLAQAEVLRGQLEEVMKTSRATQVSELRAELGAARQELARQGELAGALRARLAEEQRRTAEALERGEAAERLVALMRQLSEEQRRQQQEAEAQAELARRLEEEAARRSEMELAEAQAAELAEAQAAEQEQQQQQQQQQAQGQSRRASPSATSEGTGSDGTAAAVSAAPADAADLRPTAGTASGTGGSGRGTGSGNGDGEPNQAEPPSAPGRPRLSIRTPAHAHAPAAAASSSSSAAAAAAAEAAPSSPRLSASELAAAGVAALSSGRLRSTMAVLKEAHRALLGQATLLSELFPPGLTAEQMGVRAALRPATSGAPDVLRFLRHHMHRLVEALSGLPGSRMTLVTEDPGADGGGSGGRASGGGGGRASPSRARSSPSRSSGTGTPALTGLSTITGVRARKSGTASAVAAGGSADGTSPHTLPSPKATGGGDGGGGEGGGEGGDTDQWAKVNDVLACVRWLRSLDQESLQARPELTSGVEQLVGLVGLLGAEARRLLGTEEREAEGSEDAKAVARAPASAWQE